MLELHGGRLEIESEPGAGTRVVAMLPPQRLIAPSRPRTGAAPDGGEGGAGEEARRAADDPARQRPRLVVG
jgi:hypothetical protein